MYSEFSASRFRRFEDVAISGLNRVNVITGSNGAGKTSLLEGVFIASGAFSPELAVRVNAFRGMEGLLVEIGGDASAVMRSLFRDLDCSEPARLITKDDDGTVVSVEISVPKTSPVPVKSGDLTTSDATASTVNALRLKTKVGNQKAIVSDLRVSASGMQVDQPRPARRKAVFLQPRTEASGKELAARLGRVVVARQEDRLVSALQIIEPRLTSITSVLEGDQTVLYGDVGKNELVPLWLLGGGINHLAHIVLAIMEERGRVVLVDEIENGIYHSVLPDMWRVIAHAARESDCQVFATTHSRECVAAAHQVFSESFDYDLSVMRLEASNGHVDAVQYDRDTLEATIESDFEVR